MWDRFLGLIVGVSIAIGGATMYHDRSTHAAEKNGHDLIAVGAHGHRGVRRLLLGSVAESTIRHSPCSVLVVHGEQPAG